MTDSDLKGLARRECGDTRAHDERFAKDPVLAGLSTPEPEPKRNDGPAVWGLVLVDMTERNESGVAKYGTPLQPHNGRDALKDAYQEALDLAVYLRQAIFERDGR